MFLLVEKKEIFSAVERLRAFGGDFVKKNKIEYKILEGGEYTYESGLINGKKNKEIA